MPRLQLTDLSVRSMKPTQRSVTYWDTRVPGFGVRVGLRAKTFIVMRGERRQRIVVGRFPDMPLAEARLEAKRLLLERDTSAVTVSKAIDLYVEHHLKPNTKPRTATEMERLLRKHFTLTGRLSEVTFADIARIVDPMSPGAANHAFVAIRGLLNWCLRRQLLRWHPLIHAKLPHKLKARDRVLTDAELQLVWSAALDFPAPMSIIIALLITTGQRLGEVSALRWSWIDQAKRTITLPAEATKNSTRHCFPYGSMTADILASIPRGPDLLFPAREGPYPYQSHSTARDYFDRVCPVPDWTWHDLRRTFSTIHARIGTPVDIQEALLNHKSGSRSPIQRVYDHYDRLEPMRTAMTHYDAYLRRLFAEAGSDKE